MIKKTILNSQKFSFWVLVLFGFAACLAQNQAKKGDFWNKVRYGGGVGLGFSNGNFNANISPSAIYDFNNYISAGVGLNLNYFKSSNQKYWAYGPSAILLINPIDQLQLSGEYEQLRVNASINATGLPLKNDFWSPSFFVGLGYNTQFATLGIRYNLLHNNENSIYLNAWAPFVRLYF